MKIAPKVTISLKELKALIATANRALSSDSNDAEHDALFHIRGELLRLSSIHRASDMVYAVASTKVPLR